MNDNEPVLTLAELRARWKCDRSVIVNAVRAGELEAFKLGSHYRFTMAAVLAYEASKRAS